MMKRPIKLASFFSDLAANVPCCGEVKLTSNSALVS
jgi:hypothetical protein